jgi:hypothetical protein
MYSTTMTQKKFGSGINIPDPQHCICTLGPGAGDAFVSQMFEAETKTQIYTEYNLLQMYLVIFNRPTGHIRSAREWYHWKAHGKYIPVSQ